MSENHAKILQFMSAFLGAAGAVVCAVMAFADATETLPRVLWLLLAAVFLLLIYPLCKIGSMMEDLVEQNKKLSLLATRQSKLLKSVEATRYAPTQRNMNKVPAGETTAYMAYDAERAIRETGVSAGASQKTSAEMPTETSPAQPAKFVDTRTGEVLSDENTPRPSARRMTVGKDTIEQKRGYRAVSQFMHSMFHQSTIAAGGLHTVAVTAGGRVRAEGYGNYGQCDVSSWESILAVAVGTHHTVGLREDGTCVACGYNGSGQCAVENWNTIAAIAAGTSHTVGLLANGTCIAVGDNTYGQCNVLDWTEIIAITASANCTIGLRQDGTLVGVGTNTDGGWAAIKWGGIIDVAAGGFHTVGLKSDGTCLAVGNNANKQCEVSRWKDITAVAAGAFHTVGLKKDGTVIAIGHNGHGQCNTKDWRDIVAISAGRNHTVALTSSGRVFAVGDNTYNQCFVQNMNDIKVNIK